MAFASWDAGTSSIGYHSDPSQILGVAAPAPPKTILCFFFFFFFLFSGVMKLKANCNLHDAIKVS